MKVLFISFHFYPDAAIGARRVSELAGYLKSRGCSVSAISAGLNAGDRTDGNLRSVTEGIEVIRVARPFKLSSLLLRARSYVKGVLQRHQRKAEAGQSQVAAVPPSGHGTQNGETVRNRIKRYVHSLEWFIDDKKLWALLVAIRAILLVRREKVDIVISSGPPHSTHLAGLLVRMFTGARWVMDMRDPWSVDRSHMHVKSAATLWMESVCEKLCLSRADLVTTASPGIAEYVSRIATKTRVEVILNGFDGEAQAGSATCDGRLRFLYAGTLYYNRDPFPLLEAVRALLDQGEVRRDSISVRFVGHCSQWNGIDVVQRVREMGIDDVVEILPPVDSQGVVRLLSESDVILNFAQGQPIQIPAKLFEILASGKEMMLISEPDSDSSAVVRESGSGLIVEPGSQAACMDALGKLYDKYVIQGTGYIPDQERITAFSRVNQNRRLYDILGGL